MPTTQSVHVSKFKARAKDLLKAVRAGDQNALIQIKPYFDDATGFKLTQAQLVVARTLHCDSWRHLVRRDDWMACSFCKKWQYELEKLIAGPDVFVCNACIELCNDILRDEKLRD